MAALGSAILLGSVVWLGPLSHEARAAVTVNLDQWASQDFAWQNGNLNGNNSRYPEGGIVPFRLAIEGLLPGPHEIIISYDFTAGGHKAYDFLATWNATNGAGAICTPSGGAISSMCPAMPLASEKAFPVDPYVTDGLSVAGAQSYAKMPRTLRLWGGTITSIGAPTHSGSASGNSEVEMVVRFKATGPAVLLAWGGHLAQSSYWNAKAGGEPDGASLVSGAPWHVRTLGLDGSGSKNQDRSIQPSAIVGELIPPGDPPPPAVAPPATRPPVVPPGVPGVTGPRPTPPNTASGSEAAAAAPSPHGLAMFGLSGLLLVAWMAKVIVGRSRKP